MKPTLKHLAIVSEHLKDDKTAANIADDFKLPLQLVLDSTEILHKKPMFSKTITFKRFKSQLKKAKSQDAFAKKYNLKSDHLKAILDTP